MKEKKFNFVIGFYWHDGDGAIGCYMFHGSEVKYGTIGDAQAYLAHARSKYNPSENTVEHFHDYKIFKVMEITE